MFKYLRTIWPELSTKSVYSATEVSGGFLEANRLSTDTIPELLHQNKEHQTKSNYIRTRSLR